MKLKIKGEIFQSEELTALMEEIETSPEDIELSINSPGGDIILAYQIVNAIQKCSHKVVAKVEAIGASAAAVVALACDSVEIDKNSLLMLHHCWTVAIGNKEDMKEEIDAMKAIDAVMENIITAHAKDPEALKAELAAGDVWMTGEEVAATFDNVVLVEPDRTEYEDKYAAKAYASFAQVVMALHATKAKAKEPEPEPEYSVSPELQALLNVNLE